jgi:hypothetical protein
VRVGLHPLLYTSNLHVPVSTPKLIRKAGQGSSYPVVSCFLSFIPWSSPQDGRVFGSTRGHARPGGESAAQHKYPEVMNQTGGCRRLLQRAPKGPIAVMRSKGPMDCQGHHTESEQREADFCTRGEADTSPTRTTAANANRLSLPPPMRSEVDALEGAILRIQIRSRLILTKSASIVRLASVVLDLRPCTMSSPSLHTVGHPTLKASMVALRGFIG